MKYELYRELNLLIPEDEVSWVHPAAEWQGNLYGVAGATEDDLPALNALLISDADDVADVAAAVKAATGYPLDGIHTGGCAQGEYVDTKEGYLEVLYDHLAKKFRLVSEMETEPAYIYWDGSNWRHIWLPEPDHIVEVDDEETISLDGWRSSTGCYAEALPIYQIDGKPVEDKYLLRRWSPWEGDEPSGEIVSPEELEEIKAKAGE